MRLARYGVVPTSLFHRRTYGSENLSPMPQKDFCNSIRGKADIELTGRHFGFGPRADLRYLFMDDLRRSRNDRPIAPPPHSIVPVFKTRCLGAI
jgi:hypothetical protein